MADDALNGSWSAPNTARPPRAPNKVFCVCVVCKATGVCPGNHPTDDEFVKIDGRMYCPACAAQQRR